MAQTVDAPAEGKEKDVKSVPKVDDIVDELSEEDQQLKDKLEALVTQLQHKDGASVLSAIEDIGKEIRAATTSMTAVPKPLKFFEASLQRCEGRLRDSGQPQPVSKAAGRCDLGARHRVTRGWRARCAGLQPQGHGQRPQPVGPRVHQPSRGRGRNRARSPRVTRPARERGRARGLGGRCALVCQLAAALPAVLRMLRQPLRACAGSLRANAASTRFPCR